MITNFAKNKTKKRKKRRQGTSTQIWVRIRQKMINVSMEELQGVQLKGTFIGGLGERGRKKIKFDLMKWWRIHPKKFLSRLDWHGVIWRHRIYIFNNTLRLVLLCTFLLCSVETADGSAGFMPIDDTVKKIVLIEIHFFFSRVTSAVCLFVCCYSLNKNTKCGEFMVSEYRVRHKFAR